MYRGLVAARVAVLGLLLSLATLSIYIGSFGSLPVSDYVLPTAFLCLILLPSLVDAKQIQQIQKLHQRTLRMKKKSCLKESHRRMHIFFQLYVSLCFNATNLSISRNYFYIARFNRIIWSIPHNQILGKGMDQLAVGNLLHSNRGGQRLEGKSYIFFILSFCQS